MCVHEPCDASNSHATQHISAAAGDRPEAILAQLRTLQLHREASTGAPLPEHHRLDSHTAAATTCTLPARHQHQPLVQYGSLPLPTTLDAAVAAATAAQLQQQIQNMRTLSGPLPLLGSGDVTLPGAHAAAAQSQQQQKQQQQRRRNDEQIRRTVYVSELEHGITEHDLSAFFSSCGAVVDCRICGDATSALRFGFIEFVEEAGARRAMSCSGSLLGTSVIKVNPSKTAIVPVNNHYLPRSEEERAAVARTIYVANVHRSVEREALHTFFSALCGPVAKVRVLGDASHDTKIAFVEFYTLQSAVAALRCTGMPLGPLPLRVSASKTPVRTEKRRGRGAPPANNNNNNNNNASVASGMAFSAPPASTLSSHVSTHVSPFAAVTTPLFSDANMNMNVNASTSAFVAALSRFQSNNNNNNHNGHAAMMASSSLAPAASAPPGLALASSMSLPSASSSPTLFSSSILDPHPLLSMQQQQRHHHQSIPSSLLSGVVADNAHGADASVYGYGGSAERASSIGIDGAVGAPSTSSSP